VARHDLLGLGQIQIALVERATDNGAGDAVRLGSTQGFDIGHSADTAGGDYGDVDRRSQLPGGLQINAPHHAVAPYIGEYDGELEYVTYEWQTRRYPVSAEVQENVDGEFTVQAGRSDEIKDAAMHTTDRDERKRRAIYVREAVNGRNVKSGEKTTVPIPRKNRGVKQLLDTLKSDEDIVAETDLQALETTINDMVYEMFGITSDEQDVIEKYLEEFRVY